MPRPEAAAAPGRLPGRLRNAFASGWRETERLALLAAAKPVPVLAALVGIQWLALLAFALTVRHNGIVWYQGGDQISYTTSAWLIGNGELPPSVLGYGWIVPLVPLGWLVASDYVAYMPFVIGLNVLVLGPVALACVYGIASRIGGRLLGLWSAGLWVAAPYLAIPFFREDYHDRYVEQFLPQALGLSALADYPSLVCVLVAAALLVRLLDTADWTYAALAGLVAGFAVAIKPANALFLGGPVVLLLLARRYRHLLPYAAGVVPSILLLALWKQRGLGTLPLFALEETRVAAGASVTVAVSALGLDQYVTLDWDVFQNNMANLREFFYSARVVQWLPFAGVFAVARRSIPISGMLAVWLTAFLAAKGTRDTATVESGTFFRILMPAYPAYFLLAASVPLLVPGLVRRIPARLLPGAPRAVSRRTLVIAGAVLVLMPLLAIALPRQISSERPEALSLSTILTPVESSIDVGVAASGARRTLTWEHRDFGSTAVFYRVFRTAAGGADVNCSGAGSPTCTLELLPLATTREARFVDLSPPADALYRIGVSTNWQDNEEGGDVIAISPPVAATP